MGIAAAASALPRAVGAQQTIHRLAFVHSGIPADKLTESAGPYWVRRVYQTLRELGHVEGRNLIVERYSAEGRSERFASLAAEVTGRNPDVVIVNSDGLAKAFAAATSTIPLVVIVGDLIANGLLTNLAHPGNNLTGVSIDAGMEINGKRLQIIKEAMPKAAKVAALLSGVLTTTSPYREAARQLGIEVITNQLSEVNEQRLRRAFAEIAQQQMDAAIIDEGGSFLAQRALMVELEEKHRLPVVFPYRDYVELGGLMAYGPDLGELAQRMADDVHQILNGKKAGDIPFYQPNKFQLIINLKTARSLGVEVPSSLLARADEVIE